MIIKHRKVAAVIFYDKKGNVLIQDRREKENRRVPVDFGFFGGGIEEGESAEQAIIREMKEELGIKLTNFKFFKKYHKKSEKFGILADISIFIAVIPDMKKINVQEGKAVLMKASDFYKKNVIEWDKEILKDVEEYLKNRKIYK